MSDDATLSATDYIGQDTNDKHLLLLVPNYEDDSAGRYQSTKNTYLNLGHGSGDPNHAEPTWYPSSWTAGGLDPAAVTAPSTTGDDLLSFFGGFADDARARGTGTTAGGTFEQPGATPPSETVARNGAAANTTARNAAVTAAIPDYLGWRDHTDGHRITTTRGDKIEIIGGNYKLVSLGRGTGVATFEMSGGLNVGGDEAPGAVTSVSWVACPTGDANEKGWRVTEQTVKGNTVERFHGTKREEAYGNEFISVTGAPATVPRGTAVPVCNPSGACDSITNLSFDVDSSFPEGGALPTQWDQEDPAPSLARPTISESTWAHKVVSFTDIEATVKETTVYGGRKEVQEHFLHEGYLAEIWLGSLGKRYSEWWYLEGSQGFFEYFRGAKTEIFFGASTTVGFANRFEMFLGVEEQVNVGLSFSLAIAGAIDLSLGLKLEGHFGAAWETASTQTEFWGEKFEFSGQESSATLASMKAALTRKSVAVAASLSAALTNIGSP